MEKKKLPIVVWQAIISGAVEIFKTIFNGKRKKNKDADKPTDPSNA